MSYQLELRDFPHRLYHNGIEDTIALVTGNLAHAFLKPLTAANGNMQAVRIKTDSLVWDATGLRCLAARLLELADHLDPAYEQRRDDDLERTSPYDSIEAALEEIANRRARSRS